MVCQSLIDVDYISYCSLDLDLTFLQLLLDLLVLLSFLKANFCTFILKPQQILRSSDHPQMLMLLKVTKLTSNSIPFPYFLNIGNEQGEYIISKSLKHLLEYKCMAYGISNTSDRPILFMLICICLDSQIWSVYRYMM